MREEVARELGGAVGRRGALGVDFKLLPDFERDVEVAKDDVGPGLVVAVAVAVAKDVAGLEVLPKKVGGVMRESECDKKSATEKGKGRD